MAKPLSSKQEGKGESLSPQVGIFWVLPGHEVVKASLAIGEAVAYADHLIGDKDHYGFWTTYLHPHHPYFAHREYDEVPRGRVSWHKKKKTCIIISSRAIIADADSILAIRTAFGIPDGQYETTTDDHYEPEGAGGENW